MKLLKSGIFWTIIATTIGVLVTLYLTKKEAKPVYFIKTQPSLIYDKENATAKLSVVVDDTILVNENVYFTSLVLWNKGRLPIDSSVVRRDLSLNISLGGEIIDYQIVKETHPDISRFRLVREDTSLVFDWDFFDPKFGLELQLFYKGTDETEVTIQGHVLNHDVKKVSGLEGSKIKDVWVFLFTFVYGIVVFIVGNIIERKIRNSWTRLLRSLLIVFTIIIFLSSLVLMVNLLLDLPNAPL